MDSREGLHVLPNMRYNGPIYKDEMRTQTWRC